MYECENVPEDQQVYGYLSVPGLDRAVSVYMDKDGKGGEILYGSDWFKKDSSEASYHLIEEGGSYMPPYSKIKINGVQTDMGGENPMIFDINQKFMLLTPSVYKIFNETLSNHSLECSYDQHSGTYCTKSDSGKGFTTDFTLSFSKKNPTYSPETLYNDFDIPSSLIFNNHTGSKYYFNVLPTTTDPDDKSGAVHVESSKSGAVIFGRGVFDYYYILFSLQDDESTRTHVLVYKANYSFTANEFLFTVVYFYLPTLVFLAIFYAVLVIKRKKSIS